MMNARGKSDRPIVPTKLPNKAVEPAAEAVEGEGLAKGNLPEGDAVRTPRRGNAHSALERVRQAARSKRKQRFTALLHHVYNIEGLRAAYLGIKRDAAAGIDGETWRHYGEDLEANLQDLAARLKRGAYRAKPVRRAYILKTDGRQRPLGHHHRVCDPVDRWREDEPLPELPGGEGRAHPVHPDERLALLALQGGDGGRHSAVGIQPVDHREALWRRRRRCHTRDGELGDCGRTRWRIGVTVTATPVSPIKRVHPHVGEVTEWTAQQSLRLLWDRIHDLEERLQAAQSTITTLVAAQNTTEIDVATAQQSADHALVLSQQISTAGTIVGGGGSTSTATTLPGGGDDGGGAIGCAAAGPSGHDTGGLLNAIRAGQIICGTGNEFAALKNVTADLATRQANAEQLLLRMIWHLREAGFSAGRQQNPSGAISNDKLCVVVDSITRCYDVFIAYDDFTIPMGTTMTEVSTPNMQDDAGWPD